MNQGRVGEDRGSKEMDRCPLTVKVALASHWRICRQCPLTLTNNPTAVCTYLALKDDKYREGWVQLIVRRDA
jgi:hypothetical protein